MKHELSASLKFHSKAACTCAGQASAAFVLEFNRQTAKQSKPNFLSNFRAMVVFLSVQNKVYRACHAMAVLLPRHGPRGGPAYSNLAIELVPPRHAAVDTQAPLSSQTATKTPKE